MKIKYLGTSASEGVPTAACRCELCEKARRLKGRYIRTRSQVLVDGRLMIEFNADTYMHILQNGINMLDIDGILITHRHADHFVPSELPLLLKPKFSTTPRTEPMYLYGSGEVIDIANRILMEEVPFLKPTVCSRFMPFSAFGKYTVTPLKANHGDTDGFHIYMIDDGDKCLFYGHDSNYPEEITWEYLAKTKPHLDAVSLDCTRCANTDMEPAHMNLTKCSSVKKRMMEEGYADEKTVFILSHFSHNGRFSSYDEMCEAAEKHGFIVAYDGIEIEF